MRCCPTADIVHLRPAIPEDRDELLAFHSDLSPESLHLRFLGVGSQSARSYVESLTRAPAADHLALVAVSTAGPSASPATSAGPTRTRQRSRWWSTTRCTGAASEPCCSNTWPMRHGRTGCVG